MIGRVLAVAPFVLFAGWVVVEFVRGAAAQHRRGRAVRSVPPAGPRDRFGRRP